MKPVDHTFYGLRHVDEYRDGELSKGITEKIHAISRREARIMEVCGTHTVSIFRNGVREVIPPNMTLVSGPGCPVCVTATEEIDKSIKLCSEDGVIVATFGDLIRVPGSKSSLQNEKADGADVRIVYSPMDALKVAADNPGKKVVFLGVGFETTAPTIAATILEAEREAIDNFFVLVFHKLIPPALEALVSNGDMKIDGLMCPGHVTTVIGAKAYLPMAEKYRVPCVVTGFEPVDILRGIYMLVEQIEKDDARVEIEYTRGVTFEGNRAAIAMMEEVFEPCDAPWRGLGVIPASGLTLREAYRRYAAEVHFDLSVPTPKTHPRCKCGDILRGIKRPPECALFRKACTPSHPIGPCMVSSEGTCAAYYRYHA